MLIYEKNLDKFYKKQILATLILHISLYDLGALYSLEACLLKTYSGHYLAISIGS